MSLRKKKGDKGRSAVQNAMKTLLANIRFASVDKPVQSIVVTSSVPHEGKSTVSYNLAQAIASSGKTVVLVEADMRSRTLADMIGVHGRNGMYAALSGLSELDETIVPTKTTNLYFLDAEPHIPNPADILASKRFASMVKSLEDQFDYVIFDTPPVGTFVDAAEIGALADGVVFVVRENFTKRNEVLAAFDQLKKAEVHVLGAVLNCCEKDSNEYYYAYYDQGGQRVRTSNDGPVALAPTAAVSVQKAALRPSGSAQSSASTVRSGADAGGAAQGAASAQRSGNRFSRR